MLVILLAVVVPLVAITVVFVVRSTRHHGEHSADSADIQQAKAEAQGLIDTLGSQVMELRGTSQPAKQALNEAAQRYAVAGLRMREITTVTQVKLLTETVLTGLHYARAARLAMGQPAGPDLLPLPGQQQAGVVPDYRRVRLNGEYFSASPHPHDHTPHYFPGGKIAGWPIPRGWYSARWWQQAEASRRWSDSQLRLLQAVSAPRGTNQQPQVDMSGETDKMEDPATSKRAFSWSEDGEEFGTRADW